MGYLIVGNDSRGLMYNVSNKVISWNASLTNIYNAIGTFASMSSFTGETADHMKGYLLEVHTQLLLPAIFELLSDYNTKVLLYDTGYAEIDGGTDDSYVRVLQEDTLDVTAGDLSIVRMNELTKDIDSWIDYVSDVISITKPDLMDAKSAQKRSSFRITSLLKPKIDAYETGQTAGIEEYQSLMTTISTIIDGYLSDSNRIYNYNSGDVINLSQLPSLQEQLTSSMTYLENQTEAVASALEYQKATAERIQEIIKENEQKAKEEKEDRAKALIISSVVSGVTIIVSGAITVASLGTATPLTATLSYTAVTATTCAGAYYLSNTVEGINMYTEAENGDYTETAWNPIRDTVFYSACNALGKSEYTKAVYDAWGNANVFTVGLINASIPIVGSISSGTTVTFSTIGKTTTSFVREELEDNAFSFTLDVAAEKLGLSETTKAGIQGAYDILGTTKGVRDYRKTCKTEQGTHNNHPEMTVEELSKSQTGDNHVTEALASNKVDADAYLTLKSENMTTADKLNVSESGTSSVKSGINQIEPYSGVKQASQFLKEQGFSRNQRVEYLQSFDVRTIYMDVASANTYGIRFHDFGENAYPKGRYLYETFSNLSTREGAAIKQSWNNMTGIKQWKVSEGTTIIKGKAAQQIENGYKYQGGVEQWFISNTKYLQEP